MRIMEGIRLCHERGARAFLCMTCHRTDHRVAAVASFLCLLCAAVAYPLVAITLTPTRFLLLCSPRCCMPRRSPVDLPGVACRAGDFHNGCGKRQRDSNATSAPHQAVYHRFEAVPQDADDEQRHRCQYGRTHNRNGSSRQLTSTLYRHRLLCTLLRLGYDLCHCMRCENILLNTRLCHVLFDCCLNCHMLHPFACYARYVDCGRALT